MKIKTTLRTFKKYLGLRARETSAKRERKQIEKEWQVNDSKLLAESSGLQPGQTMECLIVNGRNKPIGKLTLSYNSGFTVGPHWKKQIS